MISRRFQTRRAGVWLLVLLILPGACSTPDPAASAGQGLSVRWKLRGNDFARDECRAAFTFVNTGRAPIGAKDWRLYFNQKTLLPLPPADSAKGLVEHHNGDFYRFVPGEQFVLLPGDTLEVEYGCRGHIIKEGDAPTGVYLALENADRPLLVPINTFKIEPFTDYDRLFPGFAGTIPTPKTEYVRNAALRLLPEDRVGPVIPTPVRCVRENRWVELSQLTAVYYCEGLEAEADYLVETFGRLFGRNLSKKVGQGDGSPAVILKTAETAVNGVTKEAYCLQVSPSQGVIISAGDAAGVFYGITTLLALISNESAQAALRAPAVEIYDAPRFHFRGFLLDVARHFPKKEAVFKLIDLLAFYKINTLNLRLTDDEGWRIEISGLPELTRVGGRRGHTLDDAEFLPPSFGSGPFPNGDDNPGCGYFSRKDFKEIIRYARQRHIQVVPEICFPSHARAAIKAMEARYRRFMAKGDSLAAQEFRLIDPDDRSHYVSAQLYHDNVVCVALESAYRFYLKVVRDILAMYREAGVELPFWHSGGDEVPEGAWSESPACRKLLDEHPEIGGTGRLHAYFFNRLLEMLEAYDLHVGGWEEAVLNKNAGGVTVDSQYVGRKVIAYVWDNTDGNLDLGYRIANAGYRVVLCNVTNLYFDLAYSRDPREPGLYWGGFQDAKDPFVLFPFDVFKSVAYDDLGRDAVPEKAYGAMERLKPEHQRNILGLQAQLWTETVKNQAMMEYYLLPKLFAFAERAWAAAPEWETDPDWETRSRRIDADWNEFANRIGQRELPRLDRLFGGFNYRIPMPGAVVNDGMLSANIAFPGLTIRCATDGEDPTIDSPVYVEPIRITAPVKLAAFSTAGRRGWVAEVK